mgnify:CR=1 FL=1
MPTLTIDNQSITVPAGRSILEAAEELGIMVPHFCYHKDLGAVGACRMCAVTVHEGRFKGLQMACLIEAEEDMVVTTGDEQASAFREQLSEWLMLNHPHDCPVCDEGGECQLQEMTISGGQGIRRYAGPKRTYQNQQLGPFIAQEMNRCIQCYRCARTYQDYCGGRDFGVMGSRNRVFFGRFQEGMLESDFSGNLVDVCPTGVFTDKTYRFKSRFWDLQEAPSVCPHCSLGCASVPGGRLRQLQRVRSGENPQVNASFICDRGRFGSAYVNHPQRPRRARSGESILAIDEALAQLAAEAGQMIAEHGPEAVLLVGSERASLESNWLLQRWAEKLGCRVPVLSAQARRQRAAQVAAFDLSDRLAGLAAVRASDLILVVGVDPLAEAPLLALALRQAVRNGGQVVVLDPRPVELPCAFEHRPLDPLALQQQLIYGSLERRALRERLQQAERPVLVGGADLLGAEGLQQLGALATEVESAERPCLLLPVLAGPNSFGTALLSLPEQDDLPARLDSGRVKMMICLENDPLRESAAAEAFGAALHRLERLVLLDYLPAGLGEQADLFIPTCPVPESSGSYINNEGRMQAFAKVLDPGIPLQEMNQGAHPPREFQRATPGAEPQPASALLLQLLGENLSLQEVRQRMETMHPRLQGLADLCPGDQGLRVSPAGAERQLDQRPLPEQPQGTLHLLVSPARYGSDLLSRYANKLQPRFAAARVTLHPADAERLDVGEGDLVTVDAEALSLVLPLRCHAALAPGCVLLEQDPEQTQLVAGAEPAFCRLSRKEDHD